MVVYESKVFIVTFHKESSELFAGHYEESVMKITLDCLSSHRDVAFYCCLTIHKCSALKPFYTIGICK